MVRPLRAVLEPPLGDRSRESAPPAAPPWEAPSETEPPARQEVPWHFWVAITAAAAYLAWRAIDGIALLF